MKHQALFSLKDKSKNINVSSAAILLGTLRAKLWFIWTFHVPDRDFLNNGENNHDQT